MCDLHKRQTDCLSFAGCSCSTFNPRYFSRDCKSNAFFYFFFYFFATCVKHTWCTVMGFYFWLMVVIMFLIPQGLLHFPWCMGILIADLCLQGKVVKYRGGNSCKHTNRHSACTYTHFPLLFFFCHKKLLVQTLKLPRPPSICRKLLLFFENKSQTQKQSKCHRMSLKPLSVLCLSAGCPSISANYCKWGLTGDAEACPMLEI